MRDTDRRTFVKLAGVAAIAPAIAGCSSGGNGGNGDDGGNGGGNGNGDSGTGGGGDVPQEIDDHLSGANLYDGSIADHTGEDEVTVSVGAGDGGLAFDPPAIRIDSSTTVVWEWTGQGSSHNVASVEGSESDFTSDYYDAEGETFNQSFDNTGIQLYVCEPHATQGMKGAIEVVE